MSVICGIYKIENLINGKSYIGQSVNIKSRWRQHKTTAFNSSSSSYNYPLYQAIRKYGLENFNFSIIEQCDISSLNERETYWIQKYNSFNNGYNQNEGGSNAGHFIKLSKEKVLEIIEVLKTSKENSETIGAQFGVSGRTIRSINTGEQSPQEGISYPIRDTLCSKNKYFCTLCDKEISNTSKYCSDCYKKIQSDLINCPSRDELLKDIYFNGFQNVAKEYNHSIKLIKTWCKNLGLPTTRKELNLIYEQENNLIKKPKKYFSVQQIDPRTNEIVNTFLSTGDAARALGKKKGSHISEACNGILKQAYGYKWRYILRQSPSG